MKMPKTHTISKEQAEEVSKLRKTIKDKQTDKRLKAIQLRGKQGDCGPVGNIN